MTTVVSDPIIDPPAGTQFAAATVHSADYYASIIRPIDERYLGCEPDPAGLS